MRDQIQYMMTGSAEEMKHRLRVANRNFGMHTVGVTPE
jgi:hypothetical protein